MEQQLVQIKTTGLSNGDSVVVTYTLNAGYMWSNNSKEAIVLTYKVEDLKIGIAKPTNTIVPVDILWIYWKGNL